MEMEKISGDLLGFDMLGSRPKANRLRWCSPLNRKFYLSQFHKIADERTRISRKKSAALTIALSIASVLLLVGLVGYCSWKKRAKSNIMMSMWSSETRPMSLVLFSKKQTLLGNLAKNNNLYDEQSTGEVLELALFDVNTIMAATESFGMANKLGEGGFGRVYKGKLGDGQEVAVKSLSKDSLQGLDEFTNEVKIDR